MLVVGGIVGVWALASITASAFQCVLPHPTLFTTSDCFDQTRFWVATGAVDILTDAAIMGLPIYLVHNLQLPRRKKLAVCFAFSFRIGAMACIIWRLSELYRFFDRASDVTFQSWQPTVATILQVFCSVFASCVPHLRPFMDSIQAGYLSGMIQDSDGRFGYGNDSYLMGKMAQSKVVSQVRSQAVKRDAKSGPSGDADAKQRPGDDASFDLPRQGLGIGRAITSSNRVLVNTVCAGKADIDKHNPGSTRARARTDSITSDGAGSHGSDGSKAMIIKTTQEWTVSYHDA